MARPLRLEFEDAIYHLLGRGNARQRIFASERDQFEFLKLLKASARRFDVLVHVFVLMGNHFHLLAQTRRANLSRWMHWLMVSYTVYFNWRHGRSGHLFQGRYKSFLVEGGEYLLGLSRYLHLNPVRGAVLGAGTPVQRRGRLRAYRWSSYRGYAGLEKPFDFVEEELVLGELQASRKRENCVTGVLWRKVWCARSRIPSKPCNGRPSWGVKVSLRKSKIGYEIWSGMGGK